MPARRLRRGGRIARGRRAAHRVRGLAQLAGRLRKLRPILLARQLFEPARGFLGLFGQRPLLIAAAAALLPAMAAPALRLRFLFLAPSELLQLFHELVDLLIGVLLAGALRRLVLVRHAIELELEQIGQILRHRALPAATAATATALHADLQLVLLLSLLQEPEAPSAPARAPPADPGRAASPSAAVICVTACGSSSAIFLNAGSCSINRLFIRVSRPST